MVNAIAARLSGQAPVDLRVVRSWPAVGNLFLRMPASWAAARPTRCGLRSLPSDRQWKRPSAVGLERVLDFRMESQLNGEDSIG